MPLDAIVKLHDKIQNMKLGANRQAGITVPRQAWLGSCRWQSKPAGTSPREEADLRIGG